MLICGQSSQSTETSQDQRLVAGVKQFVKLPKIDVELGTQRDMDAQALQSVQTVDSEFVELC